jgi:hypothetical protein
MHYYKEKEGVYLLGKWRRIPLGAGVEARVKGRGKRRRVELRT